MSEEAAVLTEVRGRVLLITLNRPEQLNAVNNALADGLVAAVEELDNNPDLTAGVLTGAGRGFSAATRSCSESALGLLGKVKKL